MYWYMDEGEGKPLLLHPQFIELPGIRGKEWRPYLRMTALTRSWRIWENTVIIEWIYFKNLVLVTQRNLGNATINPTPSVKNNVDPHSFLLRFRAVYGLLRWFVFCFHADCCPSTPLSLKPVIRFSTPSDVLGQWRFQYLPQLLDKVREMEDYVRRDSAIRCE